MTSQEEKDTWTQDSNEKDATEKDATDLKETKLSKEEIVKGKRLFGMITGTLNSLKEKSVGERKRELVLEKLQVKLAAEKKEMQEKLDAEIQEKKDKVLQARKEDDQNRISAMSAYLENYQEKLNQFNQTETEPRIYFKPKIPSEKSLENLQKSHKKIKFSVEEYMEKEYPCKDASSDQVMQDVSSDQVVQG